VKDAAELIRVLNGYRFPRFKSRLPANSTVTYHYPCHSLRYPDASRYPVDLLKQVFGADYVELENTSCCGCGGSFNLHHYDLSRQIGQSKIDSIRKTRADYVVTSCPGCMIQITDGLHRCEAHPKVVHLMDAIEPA
jgi:glycolate oxidase iron-sulfur subunit